jgi:3-deoxy-D-manno-octulosonic-acid transferase
VSPRPLPLALYAAATRLLEPLVPTLLRRRAGRGKEDPKRLAERLGRASVQRPKGPLAWLHGVSVGESLSLLPLIDALRSNRPEMAILVTSGTLSSAALLAQRLPAGVIHQFAPVDTPGAVTRFLDHWRPDIGLQVESELWPNLILGAKARGVRLALLSARMTEQSARGWARAPASARTVLGAFDLVLPQDAETAARLERLGAHLGPALNLKTTGAAAPFDGAELARLMSIIDRRPVVLAASTHPGEETIIARALEEAGCGDTLLVVAPRHPERGPAIAEELRAAGVNFARRSAGEPITATTEAYLADTLGEFGLLLRLADLVVMGGSFVPGVGGHNPLEPARVGLPILTGPQVFNARATYDEMLARCACIEAADPAALTRHLAGLLQNPAIARRMGEAALDYAGQQGAALATAMTLLEPLMPPCP